MTISEKEDRYPPTIWSRIRERVLPNVMLAGLALAMLGLVFEATAVETVGVVAAGVAIALVLPVVVLEFRADMAYDRRQGIVDAEILGEPEVRPWQ